MTEQTIEVSRRQATGKNANRRLRAEGTIPAVVYGGERESVSIQLDRRTLIDLVKATEGQNPIFQLKLGDGGQSRHAMIREVQVDPVTREVLHVDFQRINMEETIRVLVDIELVGVPIGVREEDAVLDFVTREVEVECLPGNIPARFELDVTELHPGQHLEIADLPIPEGVELLDEPDRVVAAVKYVQLELEPEEEEAELLLEAEMEEPEVIGRGKAVEEEEGEFEEEEEGAETE